MIEEFIKVDNRSFITTTPMLGIQVFLIKDLDKAIREAGGDVMLMKIRLVAPDEKTRKWVNSKQVDVPFKTRQEAEDIIRNVVQLKQDYFMVREELPANLLIRMLFNKLYRRIRKAAIYLTGVIVFIIGMIVFPFYIIFSREYWRSPHGARWEKQKPTVETAGE